MPSLPKTASLLAAVSLLAATSVGAETRPPALSPAQQVALGRALVARNCAMCHAVGEHGASPNPTAPAFRELHRRMDVDLLGEGLATGILTGHPAMPEFRFEPYEVVGIVRYLHAIQTKQKV